ncbi:MAG: hypothetical protein WD431_22690 [Cyclobacteriaceae bacterium]
MLDSLSGFEGVAVFNSLTFGVAVFNKKESEVIGAGGVIKKDVKQSLIGSYEVSPEDVYIRISATIADRNPSWAWTNPIFIKKQNIYSN